MQIKNNQKTMKAAVLYETGKGLVVEDGIEIPDLEPGQVLVRVAYSGVCRSQLMEVSGSRGPDRYLPHLLGHEGSGVVEAVGNQVSKVRTGDRVVLTWIKGSGADCLGSKYNKQKITINAGSVITFSSHAVVSENRCVLLPDGVPMDLAPLLGCALPTGAGIIMNTLCPKPGSTLSVFGVGGIGLSAIMSATVYKCSTIIAIDVEDHKLVTARELGATHTINSKKLDPVKAILNITKGVGVDFSVESAGHGTVVESAFQSVRDNGGRCVVAGHPDPGDVARIYPHDLIRGKRIEGSWGGECQPDRDIPLMAQFFLDGRFPLEKLISHRYELEDINQALSDLENKKVARALIEIDKNI